MHYDYILLKSEPWHYCKWNCFAGATFIFDLV